MPAARYWRIVGAETYAGGDLELSELHLYGIAGRLDTAVVLSSTIAPTLGSLSALQDGDTTNTCRFSGADVCAGGFAFTWDFGTGVAVDAIGVRLGSAGEAATFLAGCTLQYSVDGVFWTFVNDFKRYEFPGAFQYTKPPKIGDPYYTTVSLLLHMDGANGSTTFIDNSPSPKTITRAGNAQISTTQAKFGPASAYFDGSGSALIAVHSNDLNLSSGDFSIEFWFFRIGAEAAYLIDKDGVASTSYPSYGVIFDGFGLTLYLGSGNGLGSLQEFKFAAPVSAGTWHHIAFTRKNNVVFGFLNGTQQFATAQTATMIDGGKPINIGARYGGASLPFKGYIDDLRITKGVARYSQDFLPTAIAFPDGSVNPDSTIFASPALRTPAPEMAAIAAASSVPSHSAGRALVPQTACDTECGGAGVIYGTVELFNQDGNLPLPRRVRLHRSRDGLLVRETWSNTQGQYRFDGISQRYTYDVIAWDHEGLQQSVVANDLTPEVLP